MERNGINVVATVEIDKNARGVLQHQFPNTQHFTDVTTVTGEDLRNAGFIPERGIITGGFPCQDLSVAGKRAGLAGKRSGLYWEIIRLVDELSPKYLVLENVPGLLSSNSGRDMGTVIGALVERRYGVAYRVLDAQHFGVAQRRRRVFIVASLGDSGESPSEILAISEGMRGHFEASVTPREKSAANVGTGTTPSLLTMREGSLGGGKGPLISEDISLTLATGNGQVLIDSAERERERATVANCLPAELYHRGTVVNQDVNSGHLVVCSDKPALPNTRRTK
jgi:DNA (cytosine-5)-methyltransferase 1